MYMRFISFFVIRMNILFVTNNALLALIILFEYSIASGRKESSQLLKNPSRTRSSVKSSAHRSPQRPVTKHGRKLSAVSKSPTSYAKNALQSPDEGQQKRKALNHTDNLKRHDVKISILSRERNAISNREKMRRATDMATIGTKKKQLEQWDDEDSDWDSNDEEALELAYEFGNKMSSVFVNDFCTTVSRLDDTLIQRLIYGNQFPAKTLCQMTSPWKKLFTDMRDKKPICAALELYSESHLMTQYDVSELNGDKHEFQIVVPGKYGNTCEKLKLPRSTFNYYSEYVFLLQEAAMTNYTKSHALSSHRHSLLLAFPPGMQNVCRRPSRSSSQVGTPQRKVSHGGRTPAKSRSTSQNGTPLRSPSVTANNGIIREILQHLNVPEAFLNEFVYYFFYLVRDMKNFDNAVVLQKLTRMRDSPKREVKAFINYVHSRRRGAVRSVGYKAQLFIRRVARLLPLVCPNSVLSCISRMIINRLRITAQVDELCYGNSTTVRVALAKRLAVDFHEVVDATSEFIHVAGDARAFKAFANEFSSREESLKKELEYLDENVNEMRPYTLGIALINVVNVAGAAVSDLKVSQQRT